MDCHGACQMLRSNHLSESSTALCACSLPSYARRLLTVGARSSGLSPPDASPSTRTRHVARSCASPGVQHRMLTGQHQPPTLPLPGDGGWAMAPQTVLITARRPLSSSAAPESRQVNPLSRHASGQIDIQHRQPVTTTSCPCALQHCALTRRRSYSPSSSSSSPSSSALARRTARSDSSCKQHTRPTAHCIIHQGHQTLMPHIHSHSDTELNFEKLPRPSFRSLAVPLLKADACKWLQSCTTSHCLWQYCTC